MAGDTFVLTYADGAGSADFVPVEKEVAGIGRTVMTREDGVGCYVGSSALPLSGLGDLIHRPGTPFHGRTSN